MLFKTVGHTLLFNDEVIATFYHDGIAEAVCKDLNYPHAESSLRNQLWDVVCPAEDPHGWEHQL